MGSVLASCSEKDKEMFDSIAKTQNNVSTSSLRDNEKKEKIDIESIIGSDEGDETDITGGINENKEINKEIVELVNESQELKNILGSIASKLK